MTDFCDVSFEGDYAEDNEFYSEHRRLARRGHKCIECGRPIVSGDKYVRVAGKSDGQMIWTVKVCVPCDEILHEFSRSWTFGSLWENFEAMWMGGVPLQPCLNRVHTVSAKQLMIERWQRAKGIAQ